jgi:lysylphosphatidylglycerol synthetase-like protein (DUF2156 family)
VSDFDNEEDNPLLTLAMIVSGVILLATEAAIYFWLVPGLVSARSDACLIFALIAAICGIVMPFLYWHMALKPFLNRKD